MVLEILRAGRARRAVGVELSVDKEMYRPRMITETDDVGNSCVRGRVRDFPEPWRWMVARYQTWAPSTSGQSQMTNRE